MKVTILGVDDWTVLYIDGEKIEENHSLNPNFVLEAIAKRTEDIEFEDYFAELNETDYILYPPKLKDVDSILRGPIEP